MISRLALTAALAASSMMIGTSCRAIATTCSAVSAPMPMMTDVVIDVVIDGVIVECSMPLSDSLERATRHSVRLTTVSDTGQLSS